jgi:intein/homing endonuclease
MIPRKSWEDSTKVFDNIPEHLMNHFLRGLFDGDGCVSFSTSYNTYKGKVYKATRSLAFEFTGSELTMLKVSQLLSTTLSINSPVPRRMSGNGFRVCWGGNKQIKNIVAPWIYKDATIFLERKALIISTT